MVWKDFRDGGGRIGLLSPPEQLKALFEGLNADDRMARPALYRAQRLAEILSQAWPTGTAFTSMPAISSRPGNPASAYSWMPSQLSESHNPAEMNRGEGASVPSTDAFQRSDPANGTRMYGNMILGGGADVPLLPPKAEAPGSYSYGDDWSLIKPSDRHGIRFPGLPSRRITEVDDSIMDAVRKAEAPPDDSCEVNADGKVGPYQIDAQEAKQAGIDPCNEEQSRGFATNKINRNLKIYDGHEDLALMRYTAGNGHMGNWVVGKP